MLEGCAKNEVQNAVPNRSIEFSLAKSMFLKGCVRPLFGHFLQFPCFVWFFISFVGTLMVFLENWCTLFSSLRGESIDPCGSDSRDSCEESGYIDPSPDQV